MHNKKRAGFHPYLPALLGLAGLCGLAGTARAATFTVTTAADNGTGGCTAAGVGDGCTLREAVTAANTTAGTDTINFAITTVSHTISPVSELPAITEAVTIDGTSQSGTTANNLAAGSNAALVIELKGTGAGASSAGLRITGPDSTIKGLAINSFGGGGIVIDGVAALRNAVAGCFIGTNVAGTAAAANGTAGVTISNGAKNNVIGGTTAALRNLVSGNAIGIQIIGTDTTGNSVNNNLIGTNAAGTGAVANTTHGVLIGGAASNILGVAGAGNVISGNTQYGVLISGAGSDGNKVQSNLIGTNAGGGAALPNNADGVLISGGATTTSLVTDVISGNAMNGVLIAGPTTMGNRVEACAIGTDAAGTTAIPNTQEGVNIGSGAHGNIIGTDGATTTTPNAGNVISGNLQYGIQIADPGTTGNVVGGNSIGTAGPGATATATLPNGYAGILIGAGATANTIGGTNAGTENTIAGNSAFGVQIAGAGADNNTVQGNFIGTNAAKVSGLGNGLDGVLVQSDAAGNVIGGAATGAVATHTANTIAFNGANGGGDGVRISDASTLNTVVRGNSLFSNAGLGINLQPAAEAASTITPNDVGDADSGPNNLQNFPVISSALPSGSNTLVKGTLNSTASATFTLDFYANPAGSLATLEAQRYAGSTTVTTDSGGNASFTFSATGAFASQFFTATATDSNGNTSELSAPVRVSDVLGLVIRPTVFAETAAAGTVSGIVARTGDTTDPLTVTLSNNVPSRVSVPTTVTIPAGASSVTFPVSVIDNTVADGPVRVIIGASAANLAPTAYAVILTDNEARITFTIDKHVFSETDGATAATATLARNTPTTTALVVKIDNGNKHKLTVPLLVTIPAGQASVTFPIGAIDNSVADGLVSVKLTARTKLYPTTSTSVTILDNEAKFTISVRPNVFAENAGPNAAVATVTRNTPITGALPVLISSSDTTEARVPRNVTIPAGQRSVTFPVGAVDDTIADGSQAVTLTASQVNSNYGYAPGTTIVTVTDNEPAGTH